MDLSEESKENSNIYYDGVDEDDFNHNNLNTRGGHRGEGQKVCSGGTGEASQETLQRHFQKVMGLSPITRFESEAFSQFTIGFNMPPTQQPSATENEVQQQDQQDSNLKQDSARIIQNTSRNKELSRLSDRRTKYNQLDSYRSNASGGILTNMSEHEQSPKHNNSKYQVIAQDSIQEVIDDDGAEQDQTIQISPAKPGLDIKAIQARISQPYLTENESILHNSRSQEGRISQALIGSELKTQAGFYRAQTHEKTTDLTLLDKIQYEKRNMNRLVEEELDEFRKEIEIKFQNAPTNSYVMRRALLENNQHKEPPQQSSNKKTESMVFIQPYGDEEDEVQNQNQMRSRITLNDDDEESASSSVQSSERQKQSTLVSQQNSRKSSLVVLQNKDAIDGKQRGNNSLNVQEDIFDKVMMRAEGLKIGASSGGATSTNNPTSPVSLNMDLYQLQDEKMGGNFVACMSDDDVMQLSPQSINQSKQRSSSKKKEDQIRKFAKQIYKRHVNQTQDGSKKLKQKTNSSTSATQGHDKSSQGLSALSKLLGGLVKQQKKSGQKSSSSTKGNCNSSKRRAGGGVGEDSKQFKKLHQKSTQHGVVAAGNFLLSKVESIQAKRSKSNPRQSVIQQSIAESQPETKSNKMSAGFSTLQDSKNNTLISMAQKRRRVGIAANVKERISNSKSNPRKHESAEKSRSSQYYQQKSSTAAHQQSNFLRFQAHQSMNSPVATNQLVKKRVALNSNNNATTEDDSQLLISSMLTKSLGIPLTVALNQKVNKHQQDGLFKILKEFEEQLDVDKDLNKSQVSGKQQQRDRSAGVRSSKQTVMISQQLHQKLGGNNGGDIYRASSVPRSQINSKQTQKLKSYSRIKQNSFLREKDLQQQSYQGKKDQVSPITHTKTHVKNVKKSEIKQLSTASESLLVYDIARPTGSKQPLTVKNSQSFTSSGGGKMQGHAANIRVKTPNEANSVKGAAKHSGIGNRANLFHKYLRATDISNQKRISYQRVASSRSKRNDSAAHKAAKRQSNRTGDSLCSVRNSSLTSQRVHQNPNLLSGSVGVISGAAICKNPSKSKSSRGAKVGGNGSNDPMRVYQTYIGQTTARLGGLNRRTQMSRQGGSSIDPTATEEQLQSQHLSFQKNSVSSSITNRALKQQGLKDPKDFFQLTSTNQSTKTPSANMIINGLIMNSKSVQKMHNNNQGAIRGLNSQSSCQKALDSSLNYPQSSGLPFPPDSQWKNKPQTSHDGQGLSSRINIQSKIKVNRQSNTSLAVGPNAAAGLIIGNNTVKILKPNLSQQRLNNGLQKASSFENQFAQRPSTGTTKAAQLLQQCTGIKIKSSDIIRADLLANNRSNQSQLTKHSKKQLYQQLVTATFPQTQNTSVVEKRSNTELMHQAALVQASKQVGQQIPINSTRQKTSTSISKATALSQKKISGISNPAEDKQAHTTKNSNLAPGAPAYRSAATTSSAINIKRPLLTNSKPQQQSQHQQQSHATTGVSPLLFEQPASTRMQQLSAQKLHTSRMVLKPSASMTKQQTALLAKQVVLSSRTKRNPITTEPTARTAVVTPSQGNQLTQPFISNIAKQTTTLKRALSKGNKEASQMARSSERQQKQQQQNSQNVLLDIDQLVRASAAAAFLQSQSQAGKRGSSTMPPTRGVASLNLSRNNLPNTASISNSTSKAVQPAPLIGKKKLIPFNPNATGESHAGEQLTKLLMTKSHHKK